MYQCCTVLNQMPRASGYCQHYSYWLSLRGVKLPRAATTYKFTVIAQAGDVIAGHRIVVPRDGVMNNSGTIAFSACGSAINLDFCNIYKTSLSTLAAGPS